MTNKKMAIEFDWGYNPIVELGYYVNKTDIESVRTVSLTDVVSVLKKHEKVKGNKYKIQVTLPELKKSVNVRYLCGVYYVAASDEPLKEHTFYTISNAVFKAFFTNEMSWIHSEAINTFVQITSGMRSPRGYWNNLEDYEVNDIYQFIMEFVIGIQTREEAAAVSTRDLALVPMTLLKLPNFSIYKLVTSVYPDLMRWEMKHLPRGTTFDHRILKAAINHALKHYGVTIEELGRKQLVSIAPSIYAKFGSMKKVRLFYNGNWEYDENRKIIFIES